MSVFRLLAVLAALSFAPASAGEAPPGPRAQVMIVGLFHFSNPGQDLFNVQMDDVLAGRRQVEIARVVQGLARFAPDAVMVEWPREATDERYARFRAGTLEPSRNEVVQLGFRLAQRMGLGRVHGIDADGGFPFEPVQAFADAHGQGERLASMMARVGRDVEALNRSIPDSSVGELLRGMNAPGAALRDHGFYMELLRFGEGDEQPGAALVSAWQARNLDICARLLQSLPAGGRAVVFYGSGHAHLLQRCVIESPGVDLVEAGGYLVE